MTPVFAARRRAEEFDSLVERTSTARHTDPQHAELLQVVGALRAVPPAEPRPEFVSELRQRLMAASDQLLVPADDARLELPTRRPARERRIVATVGSLAIVGATTTMAVAAQSALPGDVLYPLKRAIENAQAGVSADDGEKGATLLASAAGRLEEVTELSREGRLEDADAIAETLNTFTAQASEASELLLADYAATGQEESVSELRDFTGASMETLSDLESLVPVEARDELLHAARILTQIDARAAAACPSCAGDGIDEIPAILTRPAGFTDTEAPQGSSTQGGDDADGQVDPPEAPELPSTDGTPLDPGSVLSPPTDADTSGPTNEVPDTGDGPLSDLTDGLLGDGSGSTSDDSDPLDDVTDDLDDVTDDVTDGLDDLTGN